MKFAHQTH